MLCPLPVDAPCKLAQLEQGGLAGEAVLEEVLEFVLLDHSGAGAYSESPVCLLGQSSRPAVAGGKLVEVCLETVADALDLGDLRQDLVDELGRLSGAPAR